MCGNRRSEYVFCLPEEKEGKVFPTVIHHWDSCVISFFNTDSLDHKIFIMISFIDKNHDFVKHRDAVLRHDLSLS